MNKKIFTLAELANLTASTLVGDPDYIIVGVADLESASAEDASFLANRLYENAMKHSNAGVIFIDSKITPIKGKNFLITENPSRAFQITLESFFEEDSLEYSGFLGIHPTAIIHDTVKLGRGVEIGPYAVIDKNVTIGDNTKIGAHCCIGARSCIGEECLLYPHVTIRERCIVKNRVTVQPGAVIGSCGFGYTTDKMGRHTKLNQVGTVVIEDDAEIGANTTIDRSRFKETVIGKGSKIDNLVQLGHGVQIGEHNIIVAQTGIAGSSKTGNYVVIGGQVAIAGHLTIADKTMIAGRSGVSKSIEVGGKYNGVPVMPLNEYNRNSVYLRNISTYVDKIKEITRRIEKLEAQDKE